LSIDTCLPNLNEEFMKKMRGAFLDLCYERHMTPEYSDLIKIATMPMPFGKYKGVALIDLPEPYVVWFYNEGLPKGELGSLLAQLYEIKVNGLEYLFTPLKTKK
jgi:uncharacterized protein (DUF3820 family)